MPKRPDSEPGDLYHEFNKVIAGRLRTHAAELFGMGNAGAGRELILQALALNWPEDDTFTKERRRRVREHVVLPVDHDELQARGFAFLSTFGISPPEQLVSVVNADDLLAITINSPAGSPILSQVTLTVTRKGEALARSIGEFVREIGITPYLEAPAKLEDMGDDSTLSEMVMDALANSDSLPPYGARDSYDWELGDDVNGTSFSGALHLFSAIGELCSGRGITFAQPLVVIETNKRHRWPELGAEKEVIIITDSIPEEGYENVAQILETADDEVAGKLNARLQTVQTMITQRLQKKRGIDIFVSVFPDDVYINRQNGKLFIVGLSYDANQVELDSGGDDTQGDDGEGVLV